MAEDSRLEANFFKFFIRTGVRTRDLLALEKRIFVCLYTAHFALVKKNNMVIVPMYNFRSVIYTRSKPCKYIFVKNARVYLCSSQLTEFKTR